MIDLTGKLEAFIITNGRSSFGYVHKALLDQVCKFKITVLRDMKWVDALNKCVDSAECPYYLRCDDDHIFHPYSILFMFNNFIKHSKSALYACALWEDWSGRIGGGSKMYNTRLVKKLGGFKANKLGKVDKIFRKRIGKSPYRVSGSKGSIVGIHACSPMEEQIYYEELWSNLAVRPYKKTTHKSMAKYKISLAKQYDMRITFLNKKNRAKNSTLWQFIKEHKYLRNI